MLELLKFWRNVWRMVKHGYFRKYGEPFLYKDFDKVYNALRNMGIIVTINTNGTLINEEIADMLSENKPRRVNITLYEQVMRLMQKYVKIQRDLIKLLMVLNF